MLIARKNINVRKMCSTLLPLCTLIYCYLIFSYSNATTYESRATKQHKLFLLSLPYSVLFLCMIETILLMKQFISARDQIESALGQQQAQVQQQQLIQLQQSQFTTNQGQVIFDSDESRRRREVLARRPSYRKILNELSAADVSSIAASFNPDGLIKAEPNNNHNHNNQDHQQQQNQAIVATSPYVKLLNTGGTIQLAPAGSNGQDGMGLPTLTMTNSSNISGGGTIQYVQSSGQDGPFLFPGELSPSSDPEHHCFIFSIELF